MKTILVLAMLLMAGCTVETSSTTPIVDVENKELSESAFTIRVVDGDLDTDIIEAKAGTITLEIVNMDETGVFIIENITEQEVAAGKSTTVTFEASEGTYQYGMRTSTKGILVIS